MTKKFMLVATVKDEALNMWEWVAYHLMIGFTNIVIYQNDSTDLTHRTLSMLEKIGAIRYFRNDFSANREDPPFQNRAYMRASRLDDYAHCDWCMTLDADEFLLIKTPQRSVESLVNLYPNADAIRINWRIFGNSGLTTLDDRLQTERFNRAVEPSAILNWPAAVKTLFRTDAFKRPGIHVPRVRQKDQPRIVTASGASMDQVTVQGFQNTDVTDFGVAQVNHYILRDNESYLIKAARGSASNTSREIGLNYWTRRNDNSAEETDIMSLLPALRARMDALDRLSGGRLSTMRLRAFRQCRKRVSDLRQDPVLAALYADITSRSDACAPIAPPAYQCAPMHNPAGYPGHNHAA